MTLGIRLKNIRNSKSLSLEKVAETLEISPEELDSWERDESEPTIEELAKLSQVYSSSLDYMILGKNNSDLFFKVLVLLMATVSIGVLIFIFTLLVFNIIKNNPQSWGLF